MTNDIKQDVRSLDAICVNESQLEHKWWHNVKYLVVGVLFGIVFVKAEIISVVSNSRNVSIRKFSYVWCDW